jgi:hypothetical protein
MMEIRAQQPARHENASKNGKTARLPREKPVFFRISVQK